MLTLLLLRHAKSAWDKPGLDDHDRALAPRGIKAARVVGRFMRKKCLAPDLVLCSGAVRTRATLALVMAELPGPPPAIRYDDDLYHASPDTILSVLRSHGGAHHRVLCVGHNPGMHALALELAGGGGRDSLAALASDYPTGALAVITFEVKDWGGLRSGSGRLERFVMPRDL